MRRFALLLLAGCGPSAFAPVTVRAPEGHQLSFAATLITGTKPDGGGEGEGALPDGGTLWLARDGESRDVRVGAVVNWLDLDGPANGRTTVPEMGVAVHVLSDGGYTYE